MPAPPLFFRAPCLWARKSARVDTQHGNPVPSAARGRQARHDHLGRPSLRRSDGPSVGAGATCAARACRPRRPGGIAANVGPHAGGGDLARLARGRRNAWRCP